MKWPWRRRRHIPKNGRNAALGALYQAQRKLDETRQEAKTAELLAADVRRVLGIRP